MDFQALPIRPGPKCSPAKGQVPVRAFFFDTYGTVCDFYRPLRRVFEAFARGRGLDCDAGRLATEWRGAYVRSTFLHALAGAEFRPLAQFHRENLQALLARELPGSSLSEEEEVRLVGEWNRLDPWPDVPEGLRRLRELAIVAPVSNGNFVDMVALARHAGLAWDIILGSSVARAYKPHPDIYLRSAEALCLAPEEVCMVAAHQVDLAYAAGHGMQTAFVPRPDEFGGPVKPLQPAPGLDTLSMAEVHAEGDWTWIARDFVDLAEQVGSTQRGVSPSD